LASVLMRVGKHRGNRKTTAFDYFKQAAASVARSLLRRL
jgi:hypothetical protein